MVLTRGGPQSPRSKAGAKWLSKIRKGQVAPKGLHPSNKSSLILIKRVLPSCGFYKNFLEISYRCSSHSVMFSIMS